MTRTGESSARRWGRPGRTASAACSSRSSTWPAQRVGCLVSIASSTRRPASTTSSSSRSRVRTDVSSPVAAAPPSPSGGVAVLPGAEVEGGEIGEFQGRDRTAAVGRTVDAAVVDADQMAVRGQPYIALEGVGTVLDRLAVRGQRVLGSVFGGSAVGDDLDRVLSRGQRWVTASWCHRRRAQARRAAPSGMDASVS